MSKILRLIKSQPPKKEFAIKADDLTGYHLTYNSSSLTLYLKGHIIFQTGFVTPTGEKDWDNWEEFITQLKSHFTQDDKELI